MALTGCGSDSLDTGEKQGGDVKTVSTRTRPWCPQRSRTGHLHRRHRRHLRRPTSSSTPTARPSRAWTSTCSTRWRRSSASRSSGQPADVRLHHHRRPGRQVRRRRLELHHQRRAQEAGQHGQLLQRRHPVGHREGQPQGGRPRRRPAARPSRVQKGTVQEEDDLPAADQGVHDAGKPDQARWSTRARTRSPRPWSSGKADAMLADSPVVAYAVEQSNGQLEAARRHLRRGPLRLRRAQGRQTEFAQAIVEALRRSKADGSYEKALAEWGTRPARSATSPSTR